MCRARAPAPAAPRPREQPRRGRSDGRRSSETKLDRIKSRRGHRPRVPFEWRLLCNLESGRGKTSRGRARFGQASLRPAAPPRRRRIGIGRTLLSLLSRPSSSEKLPRAVASRVVSCRDVTCRFSISGDAAGLPGERSWQERALVDFVVLKVVPRCMPEVVTGHASASRRGNSKILSRIAFITAFRASNDWPRGSPIKLAVYKRKNCVQIVTKQMNVKFNRFIVQCRHPTMNGNTSGVCDTGAKLTVATDFTLTEYIGEVISFCVFLTVKKERRKKEDVKRKTRIPVTRLPLYLIRQQL
ncbi:hypothetical protein EVAR_2478_1 [Eumeta japonica]|uniref:Uncharacterized protein n=1 Tax=Eumeta variegata TaxID=151549 RepID=A0A4C1SP59_EUMVA|nr:hypothetical protein EVAR_2478_1 [Eumeta japonica]